MSNKILPLTITAALFVAGCSIHESKSENGDGKNKNVSISSPFGGLKVRTDQVDPKDTGLSVYPGARLKPDTDEHHEGKANVNIDTPWFGVKVVALTYLSDDPQEKVWEFYKKDLSKYGKVLECKPGSPDMSQQRKDKNDLTCDKGSDKKGMNIQANDTQLKVGSEDRQRVVGFKPSGNGTEFSLVYVITHGEKKDSI
ncbi:MAG: hypothetical protein JWO13_1482 [Acidobacteriales bacterium]|nr:hypothetical protein [Terriglobales bacterium]